MHAWYTAVWSYWKQEHRIRQHSCRHSLRHSGKYAVAGEYPVEVRHQMFISRMSVLDKRSQLETIVSSEENKLVLWKFDWRDSEKVSEKSFEKSDILDCHEPNAQCGLAQGQMKKLVVRMTSSECQYESALQLWLLLWIFQSTGFSIHLNPAHSPSATRSPSTSFHWRRRLASSYGLLSSTSCLLSSESSPWLCYLIETCSTLALGLPLNVLLILKLSCCKSLEDLTPGHILLGVLGELNSINLWGEKTRERPARTSALQWPPSSFSSTPPSSRSSSATPERFGRLVSKAPTPSLLQQHSSKWAGPHM